MEYVFYNRFYNLEYRVYMSDFTVNQAKSVTCTWILKDALIIQKVINISRKITLL